MDEDGCIDLTPPRSTSSGQDGVNGGVSSHPWFRDDSPLVEGCACTTCRNHSRAYLYHLVCANELLSEMLLFVHNLHHLLLLVDAINQNRDRARDRNS
jgi:queuine tRNA-ribosyltransferase